MSAILATLKLLSPLMMPFIMLAVSKVVDAENPLHKQICLYAYVGSTLVIFGALLFVRFKIGQANDERTIEVEVKTDPWDTETLAKEEEEKKKLKNGQKLPVKKRKIAVKDYDLEKWSSHFNTKFLMPVGITLFIFRQWGYVVPLLLQAIMQPQQHYGFELIQIHLLGKPATGDLQRPFKDLSPMEEMGQKFGLGALGGNGNDNKKKLK